MELCILTCWTHFLISMKKKASKWQIQCTCYFLYHQYCNIKYTSKSQFQNDVRQIPQCKSHIEMCLKVHWSCSMGNDRIARIVRLIQINHLFILSVQSLTVTQPPAVLDLFEWSSMNIHVIDHIIDPIMQVSPWNKCTFKYSVPELNNRILAGLWD